MAAKKAMQDMADVQGAQGMTSEEGSKKEQEAAKARLAAVHQAEAQQEAERKARAAALKKVKVDPRDLKILMGEMLLSKEDADAELRLDGVESGVSNVKSTLARLVGL